MERLLELIVVFFTALGTGGLMVNWIGLGRAMSRLSVSTYVEFHQATNHTFDPYMPVVLWGRCWVVLYSRFSLQAFIRSPGNWPLLDLSLLCRSPGDCPVDKRSDQQTYCIPVSV
jgi:hypothetical protein